MILPHARLRRQITEHMILLLIVSAHAFSYHSGCGLGVVFQQPARELRHLVWALLFLSLFFAVRAGVRRFNEQVIERTRRKGKAQREPR